MLPLGQKKGILCALGKGRRKASLTVQRSAQFPIRLIFCAFGIRTINPAAGQICLFFTNRLHNFRRTNRIGAAGNREKSNQAQQQKARSPSHDPPAPISGHPFLTPLLFFFHIICNSIHLFSHAYAYFQDGVVRFPFHILFYKGTSLPFFLIFVLSV